MRRSCLWSWRRGGDRRAESVPGWLSWAPVGGAVRYRLHENGSLSHEGSETFREYVDKPPGTYTYVLTVCVLAFDIEACPLRPAAPPLTVTVAAG